MRKLFFFLLISISIVTEVYSFQDVKIVPPNDSIPDRKKDTVCYKYSFQRGDTITYSLTSSDSIAINYGAPLTKIRNELFELVCDSLSQRGTFFITLELLDYVGYENYGVNKNVEVRENPWKNRKVQLEIDSLGQRLSWEISDSINPAISAGGAFQSYLLFWLKEPCKAIEETWMTSSTDELAENGFPIPLLKQSTLYQMKSPIDTLNDSCVNIEFIKTGQGSITLNEPNGINKMNSIINSFGKIYISRTRNLPVYFFNTIEQKLTIIGSEGEEQKGWHYITSHFTLKQIKHYIPKIEKSKPVPEQIKKKTKKK